MKRNIFKIIMITLILTSCNGKEAGFSSENAANDSLKGIVDENNNIIKGLMVLFNDIKNNLDSISRRQKYIDLETKNPEQLRAIVFEEINKDITAINNIIKQNRKIIIDVNNKLKKALKKNDELEKEIKNLNRELSNKEAELLTLKSKLNDIRMNTVVMETVFGLLILDNLVLEETVREETEMLHTAYYIVATSKDLIKDSIIDKKDGLLGIGKTPQLSNDFKGEKFTQIDYIETTAIPVNCKKFKIITTHPTNSYHVDEEKGNIRNIRVTDPVQFWSVSKYLVIVKN